MKTATITFHCSVNYGSVLQAYALQRVLHLYGIDNDIIDYVYRYDNRNYDLFRTYLYRQNPKSLVRDIITLRRRFVKNKKFADFLKYRCKLTRKRYYDCDSLSELVEDYDAFICGSDQIWNTSCTRGVVPAYFLEFTKDNSRPKLAYAPSLGHESIDVRYVRDFADRIRNIDFLSVREASSVSIVESIVHGPVACVLDPTLLLSLEEWMQVQSGEHLARDYILVYMLEKNQDLIGYANSLAKQKRLRIVHFNFINPGFRTSINMSDRGPDEFLNLIRNARYVVTNSFHATVFALLYRKKFCTFTTERSFPRMVDFLTLMGLHDRLYAHGLDIDNSIDYDAVDARLREQKEKSLGYLIDSLARARSQMAIG